MSYPAETWAELKVAYESGKYGSIRQLYTELCKNQEKSTKCHTKKYPSIEQLTAKASIEKWQKAELKAQLERDMRQEVLESLRKGGIDTNRYVKELSVLLESDTAYAKKEALKMLSDVWGLDSPKRVANADGGNLPAQNTVVILPANGFEARQT